jgi:hypothetical protein
MPTATRKTFKQACLDRNTVIVNGKTWDRMVLLPGGREVVLSRMIRVKSHLAIGGYKGGGLRWVSIRRPADLNIPTR